MTSIYLHKDHTGKGIGEKVYSALIEELKKVEDVHRHTDWWFCPIQVQKNCMKNWAFKLPVCFMRADLNLENIMMFECTNIDWENNILIYQVFLALDPND